MILFGLFALVAAAFGVVALAFLFRKPHWAVTVMAVALLAMAPIFQGSAGTPANADGRLAREQWRLLSVAPLPDNVFIVSVVYPPNDVRTYRLSLANQGDRDAFLKAAQGLKRGRFLIGKAKRGRAGLIDDAEMNFSFADAPEASPKSGER
jgi:hypothetical protein